MINYLVLETAISVCSYILMVLNNFSNPPIIAGITYKKNHYKCMSCYNLNYIIDDFHFNIWFPGYVNDIGLIMTKMFLLNLKIKQI